jgi:hypothetical protein
MVCCIRISKAIRLLNACGACASIQKPTPTHHGLSFLSAQARFGEQALVFHNRYGGDVVGLAWRPKAFVPRPFSLLHSTNSVPVSVAVKTGEGKKARVTPVSIIPNTPGMLAAIQSMGGDALIDRVTAQ